MTSRPSRPLPIYLAAGSIFAALAARAFITPLRIHELGGDKVQVGLLFSVFTITAAGLSSGIDGALHDGSMKADLTMTVNAAVPTRFSPRWRRPSSDRPERPASFPG